ncbi:MAG: ATP-dependent DNA helicase UvrD2 [Actinobacteria bacterium]|nr:ATP-dependent DNA helicase UvrD2 [Actinomycetota bacterium]
MCRATEVGRGVFRSWAARGRLSSGRGTVSAVASPHPDEILRGLDLEQREVATSVGEPVVVIAGAGTGKTRAITHRIAYGAVTGAIDPKATLAVTFTTRAAGELRGRLALLGVHGVQARTFHSAALRQAHFFWPEAYGSALPQVSEARFSVVAEAARRLGLPTDTSVIRDVSGEVSWAKVSNVEPESYASLARASGRAVAGLEPETVARLLVTYDNLNRDRGRIDFDDILLCTVALLTDHEDVAAQVRRTYRHLVVDEYQDVSPVQQRLVDLWLGPSHDVCVVGDPAQTIHTFAGARAEYLLAFGRRHPAARTVELVRDYRSTPQVVGVANGVLAGSGQRHVTLRAQRPAGPAPVFASATDEADEAGAVIRWFSDLRRQGVDWREMAVLYRINAHSPAYEAALSDAGIPYQVRNAERFYERPEVRQALGALAATARTRGAEPGLACATEVLGALGWRQTAPATGGQTRERWESQNALMELARDLAEQGMTLAELVAELQRRAAVQHAPSGAGVTLTTLHGAKGLEWDAVALVGIHDGGVPFVLADTDQQLAEERRLLYVGVTRAREHLRISWSGGRGRDRQPSRFLTGVLPSSATPVRRRSRQVSRETVAMTCRVCGGGITAASDRVLGRHADCPSRYDEDLLAALRTWRTRAAENAGLPEFCIFTESALVAIAEACPRSNDQLGEVSGVGPSKIRRYGSEVLALVEAAGQGQELPPPLG